MIAEVFLNNNNPENKPLVCQPGSVITLKMDNGRIFRISEYEYDNGAIQIVEIGNHGKVLTIIPKTSNSILIK